MSFNIKTDEGEIPFELSLNDAQLKKYSEVMSGLIHGNAIEFDESGRKQVSDVMNSIILKDQIPNLLSSVYDKAVKEISAKYEKAINGGATPNFRENHKGDPTTEEDAINELIKRGY